jgi:hypothetical protein
MTKTSTASNGSTAIESDKPEHGLTVLRTQETKGLISLACDALSQASNVAYDLHQAIYDHGEAAEGDSLDRQQLLNEALSCLRITEHYLLMLSSVFEEKEKDQGLLGPWTGAF